MVRNAISPCLVVLAVAPLCAVDADLTVASRFVAFGFDDGRKSDFDWVAPLFTKHGAHATFNIINTPNTSKADYVANVNELIAQGHEIGDHTVLHQTFMYVHPFFNGQPEANYTASPGFPTNDEMRGDRGNGRNVFGTTLAQKLKDAQLYYFDRIGISDPETRTWRTLTDEDCQAIRNYFSVWNGGPLEYLDRLSEAFCGTRGSSKDPDAWNGTEFTKGIFTGCRTTCNHEVWDRLVEIQRQWYVRHYNLNAPPTNWSYPGGAHGPSLLHSRDGRRYFDRECKILANHYGKCLSTRTHRARSWADLLRESGIRTVSDSMYEGRNDGAIRRSILIEMPFNASLSKDDNVCRLEYFDKVSFAPPREYDPKQEPLVSSQDWLKTLYETEPAFKRGIDRMVRNCTSGRIAFALDDSVDTFTWRLFYDLCLQFCQKAGIRAISMREAYEIAYRRPLTEGNLFRNPQMVRTVSAVIGARNAPEAPDGWTAGRVEDPVPPGSGIGRALVLEGGGRSEYFLFGVPLGRLDFRAMASKGAGDSRLTIRKVRNTDPYLDSGECPVLAEIAIDRAGWQELRATLLLDDVPRLAVPSEVSPTCDGLENKICGLAFELQGQQTRLALPSLTVVSP